MSNVDVKQQFDQSLQKLAQINTAIETNIKSKKDFSSEIIKKLSEINEQIKQIADQIAGLKNELTTLQSQTVENNTQVNNNNIEINNFKTQIQQLNDEKERAISELEQLKQQSATDTQNLQKRIDECEEKLNQLTLQNNSITSERDALKNELANSGDIGQNHSNEIQKLAQDRDNQLRLLQEDNIVKMKQLQDEISAKDAELNNRVEEVGRNASQLQSQIEQLTKDNQQQTQKINQLEGDNVALLAENKDLIERIIFATQAISEATNRLQELNDPSTFNKYELDSKFEEIQTSIQQISNAIQGNPVSNNQTSGNVSTRLKIPVNTPVVFKGIQFSFGDIIKQLQSKPKIDRNTNTPTKYAVALQALYNVQNPQEIPDILSGTGIDIKNGSIFGGKKNKKTKKNKKLKGGYTYKNNSKRHSISTLSSIHSSSGRRQSKRN